MSWCLVKEGCGQFVVSKECGEVVCWQRHGGEAIAVKAADRGAWRNNQVGSVENGRVQPGGEMSLLMDGSCTFLFTDVVRLP
jgi:hypothetical protein